MEAEMNSKLFLEDEQGEYYLNITFEGLLRADSTARFNNYRTGFNIGIYSPNEIRAFEDLPPYEGGDYYFVPVNMAANDSDNLPITNKNE
jgi:hypothetical protein